MNFIGNRSTGIYALALRKDVKNPFPPESDEVKPPDAKKADDKTEKREETRAKGDDAGPPKAKEPIAIDFDGLADRVVRVPVPADNYGALSAIKGHLIYVRRGSFYYGRERDSKPELRIYSIADRKETTLADEIGGYALSGDGSKVLVKQGLGLQPLRRLAQGQGQQEGGLHRQPRRRPRAVQGVGADLRRDLAALSRLLLCREPPRLRLGGPSGPLSPAPGARRPPLRPQLRHRRDDRGIERRPRL